MRAFLVSLFCICALYGQAQSAYVHVKDNTLVDGTGKRVMLNGVNLGGWLLWEGWIWGAGFTAESEIKRRLKNLLDEQTYQSFLSDYRDNFITEQDIAGIAAKGYNTVRVPFNHRLFTNASEGFAVIDRLMGWCRKYKVYVVLDMHSAPGGQNNHFISDPEKPILWKSPDKKQATLALWKSIALRYSNQPLIAGYDLLNEPDNVTTPELLDFYKQLVATVRSVDKNHVLFVEGNKLAHDFKGFPAPFDSNMVYSFHYYTWFNENKKEKALKDILDDLPQGLPLWCGEWGEDSEKNLAEIRQQFAALPNLVGSAFWTWKRIYKNNNRYPIVTVPTAPAWDRIASWLTWQLVKPDKASVKRGIEEFLSSIKIENTKVSYR